MPQTRHPVAWRFTDGLRPGLLLAVLNTGLGLVLIVGDPSRTASVSLAPARQIMPMPGWGLAFLTGAVCCLAAASLSRLGAVAVAAGAGVHAFWAATLTTAALTDERAALTGIVTYSFTTVLHLHTAVRLAIRVV